MPFIDHVNCIFCIFSEYNLTTNFSMHIFSIYDWQLDARIENIIMDYRINNPHAKEDLCKRP